MNTNKSNNKVDKSDVIRKMINKKLSLIRRVQNGENLSEVAKDLGVKIARPV